MPTPRLLPPRGTTFYARGRHAAPYDSLEQQTETGHLGMWLFLATEILFFGGLFTAYTVYRFNYPEAFTAASRTLSVLFGTLDTAILLTSSLSMALAVHAARAGRRGALIGFLLGAAALGTAFLCLHGYEYFHDLREGHLPGRGFRFEGNGGAPANGVQLFFVLYFVMTGLHSLHVIVGVGLLLLMAFYAWRGQFSAEYHSPVEVTGLYWHFVDLVWVFLFPLLYLIPHR